ncbi:hypothetical protein [Fischerella thermalis]|jgi:hypothetical protein|uniref:DUF1190 domain-containing protein n=1 Tax=Fischerella thermalis JSC-11 TaxID=741277 RepID=G6FZX3_9CYAN|nr:hypothetical protein [Fischerella thermalis]EHC08555.1 hypothetical protein FJSC11DRAFT_4422 [Fischerella thermalis JSC-11]MBF1988105.1 hypothetical protein [Fischerella thermalis M58_A2018_009]MBF2059259.1 hypothetical protein [Fischerella thermalis M66_A2018_004]MBF2070760.1 hypothetical protein [Fischerella thermalis M48_A2018_028]PLZ07919.1 hypothetical protein CBP17_16300 [Fischerella thermalis WC114]
MLMKILRKFTVIVLTLSLCLTTVACGGGTNQNQSQANNVSQTTNINKLADGQYPVQQATYDDADGVYTLFLLNATPPTVRTENLQMARLTDDEIKQGKKTYLKVENGQPVMYLTEDFKIEYVHNVTQTQTNPQTGQQETVVVRQESGFWSPFAGALAGQALGSLLFRPQYYVPPVYQPGVVLTGYGGYGRTYDDAVTSYQRRYNQPPAVVRNRTAFRTTGNLRRTPNSSTVRTAPRTTTGNRPTGSGYGSSTLRPSGNSSSTRRNTGSSFGSGRSSPTRRSTGFGSRRR